MRFDCVYVPDSFQDRWSTAGADQEGSGEPRPSQRYSFGHIGGRAVLFLPRAFDTSLLDADPLRIKAEAPAPGQVTVWVTEPNPGRGLDADEIAQTLRAELTDVMSTREESGSCAVTGTDPLPPIDRNTPDDTI